LWEAHATISIKQNVIVIVKIHKIVTIVIKYLIGNAHKI
jgi:hypothetical protein